MLLEKPSTEANVRPLEGDKDYFYRAVRPINAIDSLKVLPVRYDQFLVGPRSKQTPTRVSEFGLEACALLI